MPENLLHIKRNYVSKKDQMTICHKSITYIRASLYWDGCVPKHRHVSLQSVSKAKPQVWAYFELFTLAVLLLVFALCLSSICCIGPGFGSIHTYNLTTCIWLVFFFFQLTRLHFRTLLIHFFFLLKLSIHDPANICSYDSVLFTLTQWSGSSFPLMK